MPVAKIILVQGEKSCEIDLVEKTYSGNMPVEEAAEILKPLLTSLLFQYKSYKVVK